MPLDERTRRLMLRKLERSRSPKQAVDHPIDPTPPVGIPPLEKEETLAAAADAETRSGHPAIRRSGDPFSRKLRRALEARSGKPTKAEGDEIEDVPPPPSPAEPSDDTVIDTGDPIARRARNLKRKR